LSHNSDLPLHWKVPARRAFNKRACAIAGFSSEAAPKVRGQLLRLVMELEDRRAIRDQDGLVDVVESIDFADLFSVRPAELRASEFVQAFHAARTHPLNAQAAQTPASLNPVGIGAANQPQRGTHDEG
jgi:hypothetical protein